ncbi:hypothetical protein A3H85_01285 [Candidatus Daviesbacteria bacterium RIFCSPLOWO2_02_FULL_40_8]|uniref:DUF5671 domain-containing protein n=1 Tax=Candidatus Daviesbacteria bacterium RIFCSPLOWO2_01_FULL_40_24 TaxID=1797787 RepID=A0A1F5MKH6_9BACT|nr:MAG: hypothetical protein A2780_01850 [Candidatus Daviesbacteria bacterium RIFCSPHIGHO2_01_FULL_41_45]OGE34118.1 MAG: hypothetical protein A3C32_00805 [Candidatus Daviesbacteria bacterium RIFCSPHIGHO2_02_FULL_41_14]OGE65800.1 MAG: hypothetical protein A3B49_03310 [Candidatus Daviesbacteria bacterium RIFCSPLOWO2_01_FULL_40_24]OGE66917.1 MAG: hypothetical protein A3H85_01285 [Candidatus Daviesbacteria bacterium RIFCSPLOWO2_02_FULL_40_8]
MRKVLASASVVGFLATVTSALAVVTPTIGVQLKPPTQGINPGTPVGTLLSNALTIIFVIAALAVLFMLIIGAFQWITSGGDKEKVGKARDRITQALVGLAILALAFLITVVVGQVLSINILDIKSIPTLDQRCPIGEVYDPTSANAANPCIKAR